MHFLLRKLGSANTSYLPDILGTSWWFFHLRYKFSGKSKSNRRPKFFPYGFQPANTEGLYWAIFPSVKQSKIFLDLKDTWVACKEH
jgi:hypothetical protein